MEDRNRPAVSIIMPVYNSENYLRSCIDSILAQDFDSFELLLIDDGSSDASPLICDEYAAGDPRVKVFHKENGGICHARNYGLERAEGEYIAFSDHDDIVLPGFLSENYRAAAENRADLVKFGRRELLLRGEKLLGTGVRRFEDEVRPRAEIVRLFLEMRLQGRMNCVWDGFFRRAFLEENGIRFDTSYKKGGEDIDFCSRCFIAAETAVFRSGVYYDHYIRFGFSTSTVEDPDRMKKFENLADNLVSCASAVHLDLQAQRAEYTACMVNELVYPAVKYMLQTGRKDREIRGELRRISGERKIAPVPLAELRKASRKWGVFAWMFCRRNYTGVLLFVKMNLMRKKVTGREG